MEIYSLLALAAGLQTRSDVVVGDVLSKCCFPTLDGCWCAAGCTHRGIGGGHGGHHETHQEGEGEPRAEDRHGGGGMHKFSQLTVYRRNEEIMAEESTQSKPPKISSSGGLVPRPAPGLAPCSQVGFVQ
ncbi:uncharacterized protein PGTG_06629 [Puccinia graminis f. sp. tritici CRL 75-36-700-3]|uniref:Uncharacterized protein n=1 Tax=Puccinia graminis f. sp. tritici (strain CRL 75-36-700-3 / race SCCL) TaxID=418459 RepID=E3K912_PUCGT|nr:uncharacterized protein PGTG_06629 [Puccinia graminis f. sp. tritici CRL 75-36-700-3]EFP80673.1 hypothetical protein PGTG_06629 [Puccinia graminis f. sp. tritici CRL 75-36-700-3]